MRRTHLGAVVQTRSRPALMSWAHGLLWLLFVASWGLAMVRLIPGISVVSTQSWPETVLLILAVAVVVSACTQQLPIQNVVLACIVIGGIGCLAYWLSSLEGVPFGPQRIPQDVGSGRFQGWLLAPALVWIGVMLDSRGVARLLLRPRQGSRYRGIHLLWVTTILVILFALAFEPYTSGVRDGRSRGGTPAQLGWHGTPWFALFAWGFLAAVCHVATAPALIDKHPHSTPPRLDPLVLWMMINSLLAVACATERIWGAVAVAAFNTFLPAGLIVWNRQLNRAST